MKIVIYGASGRIGSRTVSEALARGHEVTAVNRASSAFELSDERLRVVIADAFVSADVERTATGHDVAISALGGATARPGLHVDAAGALLAGLSRAGVGRLIVAGGAGSLETEPGVRVVDAPDFQDAWKPEALGQADALAFYRAADTDVDWTYLSPAHLTAPGERRGSYRTGGDTLLHDANGNSEISMEDVAVALLDEAEQPRHTRTRFTIAY
jgi:putative NADH-flavin reductase